MKTAQDWTNQGNAMNDYLIGGIKPAIDLTDVKADNQLVKEAKKVLARARANRRRKEKDEALRSLGLKKVRGALGGTYWE